MPVYPADMVMYERIFCTEEMKTVWEEENLLQKRLDVEAAVATAEASLGIIPEWAAREIADKCNTRYVTVELTSAFKHGCDIVAMIKASEKVIGESSEYLHFGLTTQDILDTALALVLRDSWVLIFRECRALEERLIGLAEEHKFSVMPGRPHGQHGTVITFGFKVSSWLAELRRNIERLKECKGRLMVGSISGAHGTYAPLKGQGMKVEEEALRLLGLSPATICTHTVRDRHTEFVTVMSMIGANLERICRTILDLHRPEIFELEGPFLDGKQVESSTMPHRRGPGPIGWVIGFSRALRANALLGLETIVHDERDDARFPFEQAALPESCMMASAALRIVNEYVSGLIVHTDNMEQNLNEYPKGQGGPFIQGEAVLYALQAKTGKKQSAHRTLYRVAHRAFREKINFRDALLSDCELRESLSEEEIDEALDPHKYIGQAPQVVDRVIAVCQQAREHDELVLREMGLT